MSWSVIILEIIKLLGPYVVEWIKKWLESKLTLASRQAQDISTLFDAAIDDLPRLAIGRKFFLRIVKKIAVNHQTELMAGLPIVLTNEEIKELQDVGLLVEFLD